MEDFTGGYFMEDNEHDVGKVDDDSTEAEEHQGVQFAEQAQLDNTDHRTQFQHDCIEFLSQ